MGFITLQNLVILALILRYSNNTLGAIAFLGAFSASAYALADATLVSAALLRTLQMAVVVIGVASKLPQIANNHAAKSTGQLSAVTVFMQAAGSAARVFTTVQEVDDPVLLTSALVATSLNLVIAGQMVVYWKAGGRGAGAAVSFVLSPNLLVPRPHIVSGLLISFLPLAQRKSAAQKKGSKAY